MSDLTFEKISSYFHLPINEASRELKVCATILKKVCRASGISRWPHRKIRSLDNMINQLKYQLAHTDNEQEQQRIQSEIESFEEKKEYITRNPNTSYKSIVPKSTLQSFSKSKTKNNNNSKFVVTPKSEEEVLEVLASLSQTESSKGNSSVNILYSTPVNNNNNNASALSNESVLCNTPAKHKYILPLKKEILKIEREKEKLKLLSQSNSLDSSFDLSLPATLVNSAVDPAEKDDQTPKSSRPVEKENSASANIQIISFDNISSTSKKRTFDEFNENSSLDEFRKFKSTFPSLKYQRIWDNDCSLVYIS